MLLSWKRAASVAEARKLSHQVCVPTRCTTKIERLGGEAGESAVSWEGAAAVTQRDSLPSTDYLLVRTRLGSRVYLLSDPYTFSLPTHPPLKEWYCISISISLLGAGSFPCEIKVK